MNFTLIAYRQNHTDYYRNCRMGSSSSDFAIRVFQSLEEAALAGAEYRLKDDERGNDYAEWELSLLVDGADEEAWWTDEREYEPESPFEMFARLVKESHGSALIARAEAARLASEKENARKAAKEAEEARVAEVALEKADRARLRELMSMYPEELRHED